MGDIVEMLVDAAGGNEAHVCAIAAAEIERLRDHVKLLNSFRPDAELAKRAAEIERLRDKLVEYMNETQTKAAEIERLRNEVKQFQDVIVEQAHNREAGYAKRDTEIERLRESLRAVFDLAGWHADDTATPDDTSPDDMVAHINGLIRRQIREALGDE